MPYKILEIIAAPSHRKAIEKIAEEASAELIKHHKGDKKNDDVFRFLTPHAEREKDLQRAGGLFFILKNKAPKRCLADGEQH